MRFRLADEDRQRLGCDEWIDADADRLSVAEAEQIEAAGGDWTAYRTGGVAGVKTRMWVWLLRSGCQVPPKISDLELNLAGYTVDVPSPGKAPSARSAARTPSKSAPSSRRTRSKTS